MALGDFEAAWRESDKALATASDESRDDPTMPYHLRSVWDGSSFKDKRVLVRCYHGLGDTLQFCRFLLPLSRVARRVTVEIQPELIELLASLEGPDEMLPFCLARPSPRSECDVEIMELSHALRLAPATAGYLPSFGRSERSGLRVGLCWQSNPGWMPDRSIPPHFLLPLLECRDIEFVSLQLGGPSLPGLADDCPASIMDTAKLISGLDLVVSVDTMVAHLAGALGIPLWLLLKAEPDWRWLAGGMGTVWYDRVRKFRQPRTGDWETPLGALVSTLKQRDYGRMMPVPRGLPHA